MVFLLGLVWPTFRVVSIAITALSGLVLFVTGTYLVRLAEAPGEGRSPSRARVTAMGNKRTAAGLACLIGAAFLFVLLENQGT